MQQLVRILKATLTANVADPSSNGFTQGSKEAIPCGMIKEIRIRHNTTNKTGNFEKSAYKCRVGGDWGIQRNCNHGRMLENLMAWALRQKYQQEYHTCCSDWIVNAYGTGEDFTTHLEAGQCCRVPDA